MTNEEIIREFSALPSEAKREVVDFIAFLRERYNKKSEIEKAQNIADESFVGMWKDREDLQDGAVFVRELRQNEWGK
ncbi:MAG: DUF2281 domain-containing protein [Pyrinomonadaceae bacterium]|nr:DUF2281 domain-containing protein [Pyrinomonadaceae bacterium]